MKKKQTVIELICIIEAHTGKRVFPNGKYGRHDKYVVKDPKTGEIGMHIVFDRVNRIIHMNCGFKRLGPLIDMDTAYIFDDVETIKASLEEWAVHRELTRMPGYAYAQISTNKLREIGEDLKSSGLIKDHNGEEDGYTYKLKSGVQLSIITPFGGDHNLAVARNEHGGVIETISLAPRYHEILRFIPWWVENNAQSLFELSLRNACAVDFESIVANQLAQGNATEVTDGGDGGYRISRDDGQTVRAYEYRHPAQDPVFMLRWYARPDVSIPYKTRFFVMEDLRDLESEINEWLGQNTKENAQ